ncbi:MAG: 16S rRNA (cytosine(1402)-N(4))-methyltransferase RsmH [Kineosporiaceae bacterium]|nr:16S rRNA (cytosine(1402)-N(4))-methyltransferase RsmH [Kineosporiaceae bacterium]MBK7624587.1 16S rRNA (cytosine(1402)-N(4))-methyltransferase RsmH [Kineosporiaceae bacterium]MBK8077043.1 16S rRNA (cytosine(1402)-N(4))-methyltransferase RsmH [Kineosporiaceae bacterium]
MSNGAPAQDRHTSVLLDRCVALLAPALEEPGSVVVDATLGMGGHALALLERCPTVTLIGIDRDPAALALAGERLAAFAGRTQLVHAVHDELPQVLHRLGHRQVHGILMDLGVSSMQLDEVDRGFAYSVDAPLDMRMDPTAGATAADILNTYPVAELTRVLRDYGEERFARRIAESVARERERLPFSTSARLVELVREAIPAATRRHGGNPAKRTFQALRIEVNHELDVLTRAVPAAVDALALGGRIVVMSFQSLEDRIVKRALAEQARSTSPPDLPIELPEHAPALRLLTKGAETAEADEVAVNPRAASVRLRAAERVRFRQSGGTP